MMLKYSPPSKTAINRRNDGGFEARIVWEIARRIISKKRLKMLRFLSRDFLLDTILQGIDTSDLLFICLKQKFKNETLDLMMELLFRIRILHEIVELYDTNESPLKLINNVKDKMVIRPYVNTYRFLLFIFAKDGGSREAQALVSMFEINVKTNGRLVFRNHLYDLRPEIHVETIDDLFDLLWGLETNGILKTGDFSQLVLIFQQIGNKSLENAVRKHIAIQEMVPTRQTIGNAQDDYKTKGLSCGPNENRYIEQTVRKTTLQQSSANGHHEQSARKLIGQQASTADCNFVENGVSVETARYPRKKLFLAHPSTRAKRTSLANHNSSQEHHDELDFNFNTHQICSENELKYGLAAIQATSDLAEQCMLFKIAGRSEETEHKKLMQPQSMPESHVDAELNESMFTPEACSADHDREYVKMATSVSQITPSSLSTVPPLSSMKVEYPMKPTNRGYCVIINNELFDQNCPSVRELELKTRRGTGADGMNLKRLFQELSFNVEVHENATAQRIREIVDKYSRTIDHSAFDCFALCILTHGSMDELFGTDGETVSLQAIFEHFCVHRCQSLAGKPKLILIQSCRGSNKDIPFDSRTPVETHRGGPLSSNKDVCLNNVPDVLVGYSASPGFQSFRDPDNGSWYIMSLTRVFQKYWKTTDAMSMMILVNDDVCKNEEEINGDVYKQTPSVYSTLTKLLYF